MIDNEDIVDCSSFNPDAPDITQIAPGYRNISYRTVGGNGEIVLDGWDMSGERKTFLFPHQSRVVYETKAESKEKTLFGTNAEIKYFKNVYERKKWLEAASKDINIIESFKPEQEFLMAAFSDKVFDGSFNAQDLRIHFLDIEVAIEDEFPKPEEAKYPINVITVYDTYTKKYHSWSLNNSVKNTLDEKEIILYKFTTENLMLKSFIEWYDCNRPDIISGWNIYYFDMPYMLKRYENVLCDKYAKMFSPIGKYWMSQKKGYFNKTYCNIPGLSQIDLLILYRDKFKIIAALDGGYNLDNVAQVELGQEKIKYEGSMKNFYKTDFQKFWEYNIRDVELIVNLENKLSLIALARRITTLGLCQYEQIYGSINYIIGAISIYSQSHHNKIFKSFSNSDSEHEDFEGAYVFPTIAGFYKNGCACIDVNSLYPNTMIALNLSPETKIGQLKDNEDGTFTITADSGSTKTISKEIKDKLLLEKCILSKNNTLFYKHEVKQGILSSWCKHYYNERKKYQKLAKATEKEVDKLKGEIKKNPNSPDIDKLQENLEIKEKEYSIYYTTQYAIKILLNSAYGITGTPFSPIFDVALAQSITLNGQFVNKSVAEYLKKRFIEKYNSPKDFQITISGDTDSVHKDTIIKIKV